MLIKQESVQSTFTNVSSSSLNRAVAQFIDVTVYRLQGAMSSAYYEDRWDYE